MNHFETAFAQRLSKYVAGERAKLVEQLEMGYSNSFEDYRWRVGYLKALSDVVIRMQEIEKDLQKG